MSLALTLLHLSSVEMVRGAYAAARRDAEAALESAQRLGVQGPVSVALANLGFLDLLEHDRAGALRRYLSALEAAVESEDEDKWEALWATDGVAFAAAEIDPCATAR